MNAGSSFRFTNLTVLCLCSAENHEYLSMGEEGFQTRDDCRVLSERTKRFGRQSENQNLPLFFSENVQIKLASAQLGGRDVAPTIVHYQCLLHLSISIDVCTVTLWQRVVGVHDCRFLKISAPISNTSTQLSNSEYIPTLPYHKP